MAVMNEGSEPTRRWPGLAGIKSMWLVLTLVGLVGSNVAALVNTGFHDFLYSGVRQLLLVAGEAFAEKMLRNSPVRRTTEVSKVLKNENLSLRSQLDGASKENRKLVANIDELTSLRKMDAQAARKVASTVRARLAKGVARNTAALPAESIPYVGVGVSLSVTALDIYDACETMKDINELLRALKQGEEKPDFCGQKLPTVNAVIASAKSQWRTGAAKVAEEARSLPSQKNNIHVPEVRLPTVTEAKASVCSVVRVVGLC